MLALSEINRSQAAGVGAAAEGVGCHTGIGLKPQHFRQLLDEQPALGFLEVHAENYMLAGGPLHHYLQAIGERYPLSVHGVGLSIGGQAALDEMHLTRLARLLERYQPALFSEHLAWSSHAGQFFNDLLPLPYTAETLNRVCAHIDHVQERLGRRMLLENPASYVQFCRSSLSEPQFLTEVIRRTGCGLLLDVNNVYVSCVNHGVNPREYISGLPLAAVGEIHLAGFAEATDSKGAPLLIDSHGAPVAEAVWQLYAYSLGLTGARPTLIERDHDIPSLAALLAEAEQAQQLLRAAPMPVLLTVEPSEGVA